MNADYQAAINLGDMQCTQAKWVWYERREDCRYVEPETLAFDVRQLNYGRFTSSRPAAW
jgi:hypothetical protein